MAAGSNSSHIMTMSALQFEKEMDAEFRQFADKLKASQGYHDKGIRLCETVRECLECEIQNQTFSIASTHYGGSMGKSTDLQGSDFDIVMKINNRCPPFWDVLQFFKRTLTEYSDDLEIIQDSIEITPYSIQFTFFNNMEVDLLPALSDSTPKQVYEMMKRDPINRRYYSSSLVEKQVEFMKEQSAFAHALARLAKNWYKSMNCPYYCNGGSAIFELLGVAAALEQKRSRRESMSLGFLRIVEMVENLDDLKIVFERSSGSYGPWRLRSTNNVDLETPYLLEPANCENNFIDGISDEVYNLFVGNAEVMRERLRNLMGKRQYCRQGRGMNGEEGFEINFGKLFKTVDYRELEDSDSESEDDTGYNWMDDDDD